MQINLNPEDIDSLVRDTILKSGLGGVIEKTVKDALGKGYDNPIDRAVKQYVSEVALVLIREKYADRIKEMVSEQIEAMVTDDLMDKTVYATTQKMLDAVDRY